MKGLLLPILLLTALSAFSQDYKDTTFTSGAYTCSCHYSFDIEKDKGIYDLSEKPAQFPGGDEEWKKFLKKNLDKSLKGKDIVDIRFDVDKNGVLSNFEIMNHAPAQKYNEVIRILQLSGKWFPSVQSGFCVKSSVRLSVSL